MLLLLSSLCVCTVSHLIDHSMFSHHIPPSLHCTHHTLTPSLHIFTSSQSPYALLLAASTLTKLVTRSATNLTVQDRLQLSELRRELEGGGGM